jgi:hypothetical protein
LLSAVEAVSEIISLEEAKKRIPNHMKSVKPYSAQTLWTYYNRADSDPEGETCNYCNMFDGQTFLGSDLRRMFPHHEWRGDDIYPNVHKTLWNKDSTCSCLLIREPSDTVDLERVDLWSGSISTDWTETPREGKEE